MTVIVSPERILCWETTTSSAPSRVHAAGLPETDRLEIVMPSKSRSKR